ncbi:hypothetical protein QE428_001268 [Microbacterium sp. SORGH_AS 505]|uniref:hypothetical protein n=1 Tax=Microbacterium sp. SORGH_AS_0505 TaxID=3041770 RepID=UPI002783D3E4|nr:hypothetical protein [Microbacterium sp. SORGH_AS_0505]MDQ1126235.1 hypothetical protein [Microbacterium sp. SORGH_AS_0505]
MPVDLEPGIKLTRAQINARLGGGIQGGMLTPKGGKLMLLYSDPLSGDPNGYYTDGWADVARTRYYYTGEGQSGPQFIDRGANRILLETLTNDREVHLFYAVGTVPGKQERIHEYLGQFTLDPSEPWSPVTTTGRDKQPRTAVLFNLLRMGGGYEKDSAAKIHAAAPAKESSTTTVEREAADATQFARAAIDPVIVERRERIMEDNLIKWLEARGLSAKRLKIRAAGEQTTLFTDTWVPETRTLFEVKGDATRNDVRMAVAQLLDYSRHVSPAPGRRVVVVPIEPSADLRAFVRSVGLSLAVFDSRGLTYLVDQ